VSGGAGKATILEVSYENKHHSIPGETPSQLLLDEQKKLDRELQKLQTMKTRIEVSNLIIARFVGILLLVYWVRI
jgi:hypothetical protein